LYKKLGAEVFRVLYP